VSVSRVRVALAWTPALLYAAFIWLVSSMSHPDFVPVADVPFQDKGVHFLVYGVLALFIAHGAARTWPSWPLWRGFVLAVVAATLWGALDEFHQSFVPGRSSDVVDLLADALGATFGATSYSAMVALLRLRARPSRITR